MKKKYLIVGAGVNGLTLADKLSAAGCGVSLVERLPVHGGLAQTFDYDGFKFDSGPHWVFINNPAMQDYLDSFQNLDLYPVKLNPGVYFLGKYYQWPLTIKVITQLPLSIMLHAFADMFKMVFKNKVKPKNYEDLTLQKFGETLYKLDFEPYTRKFTKTQLPDLHVDWSKIGVNRSVDEKPELDSIFSVIKKTLLPKKATYGYYLDAGVAGLPNAMLERIKKQGGKLYTNTTVEQLDIQDGSIKRALLSGIGWQEFDHVIWTGTPNSLSQMVLGKTYALDFLTNIFFNIRLRGSAGQPYQWTYYVDDDVLFNRLYNTVEFSATHAPGECYGYCAEVTTRTGSDIEENPQAYVDKVIAGLIKTRAIGSKSDVLDVTVEVFKRAYPLYTLQYRSELAAYLQDIYSACTNLSLTGRSGLFWYNNMDHSIENALEEAEHLLKGQRKPTKVVEM